MDFDPPHSPNRDPWLPTEFSQIEQHLFGAPFDPFSALLPEAELETKPTSQDDEIHLLNKRQQTKTRSAEYRKRKKENLAEKQEKIIMLEADKQHILKRSQEIYKLIQNLTKPSWCIDRVQLFQEMEKARAARDEDGVRQTFLKLTASTNRYLESQQKILASLFTPNIVWWLVTTGFFQDKKVRMIEDALAQDVNQIKKETTLSPEQTKMLDEILTLHLNRLSEIYNERENTTHTLLAYRLTIGNFIVLMKCSFKEEVDVWKHCRDMLTERVLSPLQLADAVLGIGVHFPTDEQRKVLLHHLSTT